MLHVTFRNRQRSVDIATRLRVSASFPCGRKDFLLLTTPRPTMRSTSLLYSEYWGLSGRGGKVMAHRYTVPSLRMRQAVHPILLHVFMAWCSIKHMNFSFTLHEGQTKFNLFKKKQKPYSPQKQADTGSTTTYSVLFETMPMR